MREQMEKSMSPETASQAERAQAIAWIFGSKGPCAALIQAETEAEALDLGSRAAGMLGEGAKAVFAPVGPGLEDAGKRQVAAWALEAAGQGKVALVCARLGDERMEAIARELEMCVLDFEGKSDWIPQRWRPKAG